MAKTSFFENQNSNAINPQDFNALVATLESRNNTALANLSTSQTQLDTANTLLAQTTQTVNTQTATSVQAASNSSTSATNSASSAAAALVSQNAANASKLAAATSETNAAGSASTASTQATNAAASATAANTSKVNAGTSETNALASKNAAGTSETNAATSAAQALASKNAAATSEANALASKNAAATSATNAATSETNALASKNAAATSATNAGTSETNALASKNAAATSATNAASSLTSFQNQYQGAKAVAPALRNDSTALQAGDMYFDTTLTPQASMKVYNGSAWINAGSTVNGTSKRQSYIATVGQTTFTVTGGYDPSFIDVYLNGVKQKNGVDVTVTSGTNIVFAQGLMVNDEVEVIAFGAFSVANTYDQPTIDAKANALSGRNRLHNGRFDIWQRGTSFSNIAIGSIVYTADRWIAAYAGSSATGSVSLAAFSGALPLEPLDTGALFWSIPAGGNSSNLRQRMEGCTTLHGQTVTISFYAKVISGTTTLSASLTQNFGSAGSAAVTTASSGIAVLNGVNYDRYSLTLTLPAVSGKTIGAGDYLELQIATTGTAAHTIGITAVQVEAGSIATPYEIRSKSHELMSCQRFYWKASNESFGLVVNTQTAASRVNFPVPMRVQPTLTNATFSGGNATAGALTLFSSSATSVCYYNSAATWTVGYGVTAFFEANADL